MGRAASPKREPVTALDSGAGPAEEDLLLLCSQAIEDLDAAFGTLSDEPFTSELRDDVTDSEPVWLADAVEF